ncbi:MAG: hypothetical protein EOO88_25705 [Pedobacter sp.]|nr:MAG: hypothetical protein EOO88_25705 [Pedobacter sp.]
MKTILFYFATFFLSAALYGQKQRLVGDDSRWLCKNDSISEVFIWQLRQQKVDSIISVLYDYDNGRLYDSKQIVFWTKNGINRLRLIEGCDSIRMDITVYTSLSPLWEFVRLNRFDPIQIPIPSFFDMSHDRFYYVELTAGKNEVIAIVRDFERTPDPRNIQALEDSRVILVNKIEDLLKTVLQPTGVWRKPGRVGFAP